MSNIHGNKEKFDRMLELIKFDEKEDYLYILGDTVDYGKDGIKILLDISMRPNVYHLLGEHEAKARDMIKRFVMISSNNLKPDPEFIASFRKWTMEEGGMPTFEAFSALNEESVRQVKALAEELAAAY